MKWIYIVLIPCFLGCEPDSQPPSSAIAKVERSPTLEFSGFLRSHKREGITPPNGQDWSFKILQLIDDGVRVKAGEPLVQLEGERVLKNLREAENSLIKMKIEAQAALSETKIDIDSLEVSIADKKKELAVLMATSANPTELSTEWLISSRDQRRDAIDIELKQLDLTQENDKIKRKRELLAMKEISTAKSLETQEQRVENLKLEISSGNIVAPVNGVVVHKLIGWKRQKPKVGGMVHRGNTILEIVDDKSLWVEAYLRETQWSGLSENQVVSVKILGRRETSVDGTVRKISKIVMPVSDWDRNLPSQHAMYDVKAFRVTIELREVPDQAKPDGEVYVTAAVPAS